MTKLDKPHSERKSVPSKFETEAEGRTPSFLSELWEFLTHNKKWWLTPIVVVLLLLGLLVFLTNSAVAPFIYALF